MQLAKAGCVMCARCALTEDLMRFARRTSTAVAIALLVSLLAAPVRAEAPATSASRPTSRPALPTRAETEAYVKPLLDGQWCPGLVVGVVSEEGSRVYGFGRVSDDGDRAPDGETLYEIGSITKTFTCTLLAELVGERRLALDDPVQKFLPDGVKVPQKGDHPITLAHLATHMSGLPRMPGNFHPKDATNPYLDYPPQRMYAFLNGYKPEREPGASYEYSNLGVGLLGHVLTRVTGQAYERLLVERICRPLGMRDTRITLDDQQRARLAPGHDINGMPAANWDFDVFAGAGAIRSCGNDMTKYLAAQMGLIPGIDPPLSAAITLTHERRATVSSRLAIGLGWHINTVRSVYEHAGQTGGYHTYISFSPEKKVGVVLLSSGGSGVLDRAGERLLGRMMGESSPPLELAPVVPVDAKTLDRYAGTYGLSTGQVLTITRNDEVLWAQVFGQPRARIYAASREAFIWHIADAKATFEGGGDGPASKVVLIQNGKAHPGLRLKLDAPGDGKGDAGK